MYLDLYCFWMCILFTVCSTCGQSKPLQANPGQLADLNNNRIHIDVGWPPLKPQLQYLQPQVQLQQTQQVNPPFLNQNYMQQPNIVEAGNKQSATLNGTPSVEEECEDEDTYPSSQQHQQQVQQQHNPRPQQQQQNQFSGLAVTGSIINQTLSPTPSPRLTNTDSNGYNNAQLFNQHQQQQQNARTSHEKESLRKALMGLQNPQLLGGDILVRFERRKKFTPAPTVLMPTPNGIVQRGTTQPRLTNPNRLIKFERSALVSTISLWPNGVIYYEFDPSVSHLLELILKVMQQYHDETCIRFVPRLNNEPDYLRIEARKGCFSYIGRIGGEQTLSLGDGCEYRGTIAHELLHSVGFYHHQNRSDRDDFLDILWENIARGKESQFYKMAPQENVLLNEFDYNSIMLYGPRTFGKTLDKVTMKPKREGVILLEVVEKQGLSALDADSVNKLYRCDTPTK